MTTLPLITQIALARRAVLAGAPIGDPRAITVVAVGPIGRDGEGKAYFVHKGNSGTDTEWLPLISDASWVGWVQSEVNRQGRHWMLDQSWDKVEWAIRRFGSTEASGKARTTGEALVEMLEALAVGNAT